MFVSPRFATPQRAVSRRLSLSKPCFGLLLTRDASWMRFMARAALGGWLLPLLLALFAAFGAAPAQAQDAATPNQTVVVLDFAVADGLDPLLGRKAADALAVELQRSGEYTVVTRSQVEDAVGQQAGLQPPFNDTAQIRLAQTVGARSVFSGRIVGIAVTPGRLARAGVEVTQLDSATGDYINGTQVFESTEQKLQPVANEILVDEALNKAAFSAARSIKQTNLPVGTVLNTTANDVELSIGARNGVANGQRYSVLRDVFNQGRQVTERLKIAELRITRTENDQSVAVLSAGGAAGVRTGDRIRKIFVPGNYPVSAISTNGGSTSPVTSAPVRSRNGASGVGGLVRKGGRAGLATLGLLGLIALVGFGGDNSNSNTSPNVNDPVLASPTAIFPYATISFTAGFKGINFSKELQGETLVGYLIYRGEREDFQAGPDTLQSFINASSTTSATSRVTYSDPPEFRERTVTITPVTTTSTGTTPNLSGGVSLNDVTTTTGTNQISQIDGVVTLTFTQRPAQIGQTYYYRVGRITAERSSNTTTDGTTSTTTASVTLAPVLSRVSGSTGGFTPLVRPLILRDQTQYNTDNFSVRINFDSAPYFNLSNLSFDYPSNLNVGTGVDQFRVQVSTSLSFSDATTFTSPTLANPNPSAPALSDIVLDLNDIRIPGDYTAGSTTLYARVLSRNSTDANPTFRVSPTLNLGTALGADSVSSRFVNSTTSQRGQGVNINRTRNRTLGVGSSPRVLRPY